MNVKLLSDRILVKPLGEEEVSKSGIILPETVNKEKPEKGEVVVIGPGKLLENGQRQAMTVAPGNKVIFKKYSPDEIKVDGSEYLVLEESDILAIIE